MRQFDSSSGGVNFWEKADALKEFSRQERELNIRMKERLNTMFSADALLCTSFIYAEMRYQVDCGIGKFSEEAKRAKEAEIRNTLSSYLNIAADALTREQMIEMVQAESLPVQAFLEEYKRELKCLYQNFCDTLWHVSPKKNIHQLHASKNKVNMYYTEICNAIYAASDYYEILLYSGRAVAGAMYVLGDGAVCIYEKNPFGSVCRDWVTLREEVAMYKMSVDSFEPVIDFTSMGSGRYTLEFGHEWIARKAELPCWEERIARVPLQDLKRYQFYYDEDHMKLIHIVNQCKKRKEESTLKSYLESLVSQRQLKKVEISEERLVL